MFIEAIRAGLAAGERSLSRDAARDIISGGLLRFLAGYYGAGDLEECAECLYYTAKASCALSGDEREDCVSCLMLCAGLDTARDEGSVRRAVCKYLGVEDALLDAIIRSCGGG